MFAFKSKCHEKCINIKITFVISLFSLTNYCHMFFLADYGSYTFHEEVPSQKV